MSRSLLPFVLILPLGFGSSACGDGSGGDDDTDTFISGSGVSGVTSAETGDASGTSGSSSGTDGSTSASDTSSSMTDTGTSATDGGETGTATDTGQDPVPTCQMPCSTVADCVQAGTEGSAYDQDNYQCTDGVCEYLGCYSDAECSALGDYVCGDASFGVPFCVAACTVAADCTSTAGPAYDADNYSCENGGCVYTGCTSDAECDASVSGTVCVDLGAGYPTCVGSCETAADCDLGQLAYDADNYACVSGHCEYTGCNSDAECMQFSGLVCV